LIESSIEGCKVTILSYGQKSSGKTFTILGSNDQDQLGLLPRTIDLLFSLNQNLKITISNFEISNETVNDLFANYSNNQVTNIEVCGASLSSSKYFYLRHCFFFLFFQKLIITIN